MTETNPSVSENLPTLTAEQAEVFPPCEPLSTPLGSRVLVQIRSPKTKTKGGIILTNDIQEVEKWNTQIGRVIAVGPIAFKNRTSMNKWPEGEWVKPGDFVRVPKHGGDKYEVELANGDTALFVTFNDHEMIAKWLGDPVTAKAYI